LFGAPTVTGDSIDFNPVLFNALSQFGRPADSTDGQLTFHIQAHAGRAIRDFSLSESGITIVVGSGTDATYTDVSAAGNLRILEVDGNPITAIDIPIDLAFTPNADGTWELGTDGLARSVVWNGDQSIDVAQALIDNGILFAIGATRVFVDVTNSFFAQSEGNGIDQGTFAFIDKKDFGGLSITVNRGVGARVPEPASMFAFLLVAMGPWLARRSR
jgi:hypothetical protein